MFDFRSNPEIQKLQASGTKGILTEWPGIERVFCPVFPDESYDPVNLAASHADYMSEDVEVFNSQSSSLKSSSG